MSRTEMKDWIVMSLAFGTIILLFVITLGDFWIAMQENREPSKDVVNLLASQSFGEDIASFLTGTAVGKETCYCVYRTAVW